MTHWHCDLTSVSNLAVKATQLVVNRAVSLVKNTLFRTGSESFSMKLNPEIQNLKMLRTPPVESIWFGTFESKVSILVWSIAMKFVAMKFISRKSRFKWNLIQ